MTVSVGDMDKAGVYCVGTKDEEGEESKGSGDSSMEEEESEEEEEERDIIEMDETRKEDRMDCESILRYLVM